MFFRWKPHYYITTLLHYSFDNFHNIIREYNKLTDQANRITINKGNSVEKAQEKLRLQEVYDFVKSIGYEELIHWQRADNNNKYKCN